MTTTTKRNGAKRRRRYPPVTTIIEFLNDSDGASVRRDIARAFGVKGEARAELRALLKDMEEEGVIDLAGGKRVKVAGKLPPRHAHRHRRRHP